MVDAEMARAIKCCHLNGFDGWYTRNNCFPDIEIDVPFCFNIVDVLVICTEKKKFFGNSHLRNQGDQFVQVSFCCSFTDHNFYASPEPFLCLMSGYSFVVISKTTSGITVELKTVE